MPLDDLDRRTQEFMTFPAEYFGSWYAMQHVEPDLLQELQLRAIQMRFEQQRGRIEVLATLAAELEIDRIDDLEDIVPLLLQHSAYKSYPAALLDRSRFDHLTRWLGRLTTSDLSGVDAKGCDTIDGWLDLLDATTDLRVVHSSGTGGTISFLPRALDDWQRMYSAVRCGLYQFSDPQGSRDHAGETFELIWPLYRRGRSSIGRLPEMALEPLLGGSEDRLHALREGRLSADAMYVAARVRASVARGELDRLELNPALQARREEFEREQHELANGIPRFLERTIHRLRGRRVWIIATWNVLHQMAEAGLDQGLESVFAPDSLITTGGGAKGQVVPDDWEEAVTRFAGVDRLQHIYGMTEMTAMNKMCEAQQYHFEPWVVPFALDPDDGTPRPRSGTHTGRLAFFDVLPASHWGGFVTGDEVTLHWSPCTCGRTTPHVDRQIERFSDKQGGDKITCAATDDAHNAALDVLTRLPS